MGGSEEPLSTIYQHFLNILTNETRFSWNIRSIQKNMSEYFSSTLDIYAITKKLYRPKYYLQNSYEFL